MLTAKNFKAVLMLPCVVMKNPKMIFFRIPKNASTSLHRGYLQPNYVTLNMKTNKTGFTKFLEEVTFDWFEEAFKFTFVRNPWDRFVSLYVYFTTYAPKKKGSPLADRWEGPIPSFEEFVLNFEKICETRDDIRSHAIKQTAFAYHKEWKFVDFIGRFESLKKDFDHVREELGLKIEPLEHMMQTEHEHYSLFYNDRTRRKVTRLYQADIENFGYRFYQSKLVARGSDLS